MKKKVFQQIEIRYAELARQASAGTISYAAYEAAVNQLRVQDAKGLWWQISPQSGQWVCWDGTEWRPGTPYARGAAAAAVPRPDAAPRPAPAAAAQPTAAQGDPFDRAAEQYRQAVARRNAKQLNDARFRETVAQLRVQDGDGAYWQISPETGSWMRWDGKTWQDAEPPLRTADGAPARQPSIFADFADRYRKALAAVQSGKISREQFDEKVARLRVEDAQGWWQINPADGKWLRWDGRQWIPGQPPEENSAALGSSRRVVQGVAAIAKDEIKTAGKSLGRSIFVNLFCRAALMVASYFGAIEVHARMVGYLNNGFQKLTPPYGHWLHLDVASMASSWSPTVIWGAFGVLVSSLGMTLLGRGPIAGIRSLIATPFTFLRQIRNAGKGGTGAAVLGAGVALALGSRVPMNSQSKLALCVAMLFFGMGGGRFVANLLLGILRRTVARAASQKAPLTAKMLQFVLIGMSPGFLLASYLPEDMQLILGIGLLATGGVLLAKRGAPKPALTTFLTLVSWGSLAWLAIWLFDKLTPTAHAHDNGFEEYGGDPKNYWNENGPNLKDHSQPAGKDAVAGGLIGGEIGTDEGKEPPPGDYSYSLVLSPTALNLQNPGRYTVSAYVVVSGPDPAVCASEQERLTAAIAFSMAGNCRAWFATDEKSEGGSKIGGMELTIPEDAGKQKGPHVAHFTATVSTPKGTLARSCVVTLSIAQGFELRMDEALQLTANEGAASLFCSIACTDDEIEGADEIIQSATPAIRFEVTGAQAHWIREADGGYGRLAGELSGGATPGKSVYPMAEVPRDNLTASPPFSAQITASVTIPNFGSLSKAAAVDIAPPEWFIEARWNEQDLVLDGQDTGEFAARIIPVNEGKLSLYGGAAANVLNNYLRVQVTGANSGAVTFTEKAGESGFKTYAIALAADCSQLAANTVDIELSASLPGRVEPQILQLNLQGKPTLRVSRETVALLSGGDPVEVKAQVEYPGAEEWNISAELQGIELVDKAEDAAGKNALKITLTPKTLPEDSAAAQGTLKITATSSRDSLEPVSIPVIMQDEGLQLLTTPAKVKLDPKDRKPGTLRVRVQQWDAQRQEFVLDRHAMANIEFRDFEAGNYTDGDRIFRGAGVSAKFLYFIDDGPQTVAVYEVKPKAPVPGDATPIDALWELYASNNSEDDEKYTRKQKIEFPIDPLMAADPKLAKEIENCKKIILYLPEDVRPKWEQKILARDAYFTGSQGLYKMRHDIWAEARDFLMREVQQYLEEADYNDRVLKVLEWEKYICNLAFSAINSIVVPAPFNMATEQLKSAVEDCCVTMCNSDKTVGEWASGYAATLYAEKGTMALDIGIGFVFDLDTLTEKLAPRFNYNWVKAAVTAAVIVYFVTFVQYLTYRRKNEGGEAEWGGRAAHIKPKEGGEPYSIPEAAAQALRDLRDQIIVSALAKSIREGRMPKPKDGAPPPAAPGEPESGLGTGKKKPAHGTEEGKKTPDAGDEGKKKSPQDGDEKGKKSADEPESKGKKPADDGGDEGKKKPPPDGDEKGKKPVDEPEDKGQKPADDGGDEGKKKPPPDGDEKGKKPVDEPEDKGQKPADDGGDEGKKKPPPDGDEKGKKPADKPEDKGQKTADDGGDEGKKKPPPDGGEKGKKPADKPEDKGQKTADDGGNEGKKKPPPDGDEKGKKPAGQGEEGKKSPGTGDEQGKKPDQKDGQQDKGEKKPGTEGGDDGKKGTGKETPGRIPSHVKDQIQDLQNQAPGTEVGLVYDENGNVTHTATGESGNELNWQEKGVYQVDRKGKKTVHTHPRTETDHGGAHSGTDVANAIRDGQLETQVVGSESDYTVKIDNEAIGTNEANREAKAREVAKEHKELLKANENAAQQDFDALDKQLKKKTEELQVNEVMAPFDKDAKNDVARLKQEIQQIKDAKNSIKVKITEKTMTELAKKFKDIITFEIHKKS